jgi:hypothetical protein
MTIRRSLAVLLAAGLALTAAACSDDGSEEGSGSSTSTSAADTPEQTTTTISDEEFFAAADQASAAVEAAGTDLCAVGPALSALPMAPSTPAQLERMLQIFQQSLDVAASTLESDDPQSAEALRTAARDLIAEAEAADYDLSLVSGDSVLDALRSTEYMQASEALDTKYKAECGTGEAGAQGNATSPSTVPEG